MKVLLFGKKNIAGFSTIELLVALTIITLTISAVILVVFGNQSSVTDAETNNEALYLAQQQLESIRATARQNFTAVAPGTTTTTQGIFTKDSIVTQIDDLTKKVVSRVSYSASAARPQKVELTTLLDNWQAAAGSSTCSQALSGNWKNPQSLDYEFGKDLVIPADASSGYPITDVSAVGNRLYATVNNTHGNNNSSFFVFTITNSATKPSYVAGIDNDPASGSSEGLNAVTVAGKYAYVANARQIDFSKSCSSGLCGQLQIIDISVTPPQVIKTFKLPGITGKNGQAIGSSIYYKNGYVYLGLTKTLSGPEFNIIDVHDPLNPVYKGGYSVGNTLNKIFINNTTAYIATPNSENMTILDVTNSTSPVRLGGYSPAGGSNGETVVVLGTTAYLGRTFGTTEFYVLNVTNPAAVAVLGSKDIGSGSSTSIHGLFIRGTLAFFITNGQFQIWDMSNLASIGQWASPLILPGGSGTALGCSGNTFYVGSLPANEKGFISVITPGP